MKKRRSITTTLPYVNADPHMGFALEVIQADVLARLWRLEGHEVFFNTGTDEHGQKVAHKAEESGLAVQAYVDEASQKFYALKDSFNLSFDNFIRTTDEHHKKAAQEMWKRCYERGDIYKKKYKGNYCVGDEVFLRESDLVDGKCPNHPHMELQDIEEENYFFAFSKYEDKLLTYLKEDVVVPEWRKKEAIAFVENGLEDFSISREKERMSWGIPVPNDDTQVMYVWFDALTNYISTLGWPDDLEGNFKTFWEEGEVVQTAGKDQVRFQSLMWQAMLMSAGIKNTDRVFYHGFITSEGKKMSKSLGNVIHPDELVARYGTDATRYLLLRHVHPFEDTDITWERLDEWYEAGLVNGLGNLVARTLTLSEKYLDTPIKKRESSEGMFEELEKSFRFNEFLDGTWLLIQGIDRAITEKEPFKVIKEDEEQGKEIIAERMNELFSVALQLKPFMPETAEKIEKAILENKKPENLFPRLN